ncbi:MAG: peptidylprolyl isomerase [Pseudomonadota bacterium]
MTRNARFSLALAVVMILWIGLPQRLPAAEPADAVAIVNGQPISRAVYDRELNGFLRRMAQAGRQPSTMDMADVRKQIVNNLVASELLWLECQRLKLVPDAAEIDTQVAAFRGKYDDLAKLNEVLTQVGLTDADLRGIIERQAAIRKLIASKITDKIKISEKDAKAFYNEHLDWFHRPEQVKASHILIKAAADATDEIRKDALKRAEEIRKKALAGDDFAALARQYSEGPNKENGGELPMFSREHMVKPFSDAAFALKPGEISAVVETEYGYHIIRVSEHLPEGSAPFDEVSEGITAKLRQEEVNRRVEAYVEKLKGKAKITLNVPDA